MIPGNVNRPRDPKLCTREVCNKLARDAQKARSQGRAAEDAYCSDECHHIARACAYNTTTPALDSWSWLPAKPREVRAPTTD